MLKKRTLLQTAVLPVMTMIIMLSLAMLWVHVNTVRAKEATTSQHKTTNSAQLCTGQEHAADKLKHDLCDNEAPSVRRVGKSCTICLSTTGQLSVPASADSYIVSGKPNESFENSGSVWVGYDQSHSKHIQRALLRFDNLAIPRGSLVTEAKLSLFMDGTTPNDADMSIAVYPLRSPWSENINWTTHQSLSVDQNPIATTSVSTTFGWYEWDITSLVQEWINNPTSNFGVILRGDERPGQRQRGFWSKDCNPSRCESKFPELVVQWEAPTPTPTATPTNTPTPTATPTPSATPTPKALLLSLANEPKRAVKRGDRITYTISYENIGKYTLNNILISGRIPMNTTYLNAGPYDSNKIDMNVNESQRMISWSLPDLSPNPSLSGNPSLSYQVVVGPLVDLAVSQQAQPEPVYAGEQLTYRLTLRNNSASPATNVMLTNTLPSGVTLNSINASPNACRQSNNIVTCSFSQLASQPQQQITLVVNVPERATGSLTNRVEASATEYDPDESNNRAMTTSTIQSAANLAVNVSQNPDPVPRARHAPEHRLESLAARGEQDEQPNIVNYATALYYLGQIGPIQVESPHVFNTDALLYLPLVIK
ncbi:MAG: DNRLRE domain-containing protein [Ardenticatenaceae bacterium]